MAEAQLSMCDFVLETDIPVSRKKRKITFNIDTSHYISIFKNESGESVINIRKGTRSVSVSKVMWSEL